MPRTMFPSKDEPDIQGQPDEPESASFGDDFNNALDAAAGRKVTDQEALDFMNSEEGKHAVAIWNIPDDKIAESTGGDDPVATKIDHIGYVFSAWAGRNKTAPADLMASPNPMITPVGR